MSDLYTPRSLTQAEIEDILSGIEPNRLGIPSASKLAQDEIKNVLRKQLKSIELVPSGIPEMKRVIRQKYNRAIIEPETAVGFLVSEALAAPITQMTLNTFHQSGSSKNVSFGIEALKELFNVSEERKNYNTIITFNDCELSYD